jgi:dihydrofolate reductase
MRRVVASEYVSVDGVADEPGQWSFPYFSDDLAMYKRDELFASDALLLGRVTYEGFAGAWPEMTDEQGFADRMNSLPKHVASTTLTDPTWNASVIEGDVADAVAKLKQESGQDLLLGGSFQLLDTLMQHDLVDEYRLLVHPIVVGSGRGLFDNTSAKAELELTGSQTFDGGVVALTYRPVR